MQAEWQAPQSASPASIALARRRGWSRAGWLRFWQLPSTPAAVVLLIYLFWLGVTVPQSHDGRDFIVIGPKYMLMGHGSTAIHADAYVRQLSNPGGFDGQFSYYIALDPLHAASYLDEPAYRYTRIFYPLLAHFLALGQLQAIPYALLVINWLAIGGGALAVAAWLRRRGISVWFSLVFGLYPGLFQGLKLDLTEPLCYGLVAFAVYLYDRESRRRVFWSGLVFALAVLTRESSALFPLCFGLKLLFEGTSTQSWLHRLQTNWLRAGLLLGLAIGPMILLKEILLWQLGSAGMLTGQFVHTPFVGLLALYPWQEAQIEELRSVYFPALICAGMAFWALARGRWQLEIWLLLVNIGLFVVLPGYGSVNDYVNSGRISIGVVLAAIYCLPQFDHLTGKHRGWFWCCSALWLSLMPIWVILPLLDPLIRAIR